MKNKYKTILAIIMFLILSYVFANWQDFKAGLSGKQPVEKVSE